MSQALIDAHAPQKARTSRAELQAYLRGIVLNLPEQPGCYQYLDAEGVVIYVGKAKNLKRRVSSYFNKEQQSLKTALLVRRIRDIRYVVVNTEADALLLENNLIKHYKPHYNVLLKDDKTYPSIAITREYLPRIVKTRQRTLRGAEYFGPYSHTPTLDALLALCRDLYHPRPCRHMFTEEGVREGKYAVCLDYHIRRCGGACAGRQTRDAYLAGIDACREILRGNTRELQRTMREQMIALSAALRFEEAQEIKERYDLIDRFIARSEVVSPVLHNIDVFSIESDEQQAYINYLHVVAGCVTQAFTFAYRKRMEEDEADLLRLGIVEMRQRYASASREIIVPFAVDLPEDYALQTIPQKGDKRKLLALSQLNVKQYKFDRMKQAEKLNPEQKSVRLMKEIQGLIGLPTLPLRIELFDNSNLQGDDAVSVCVVFEKLKAAKSQYRKYEVKTVHGQDDYATMHEVAVRRYSRMKEEGAPLPDLIIADGGKGQMEVLRRATQDALGLSIPIAGLAKDSRHRTRELLYGFPPASVAVRPDSSLFRLLTQMQDEVHRFAIAYHRDKRSRRLAASALDNIKGVGKQTKALLLKHFGSVKEVLRAPERDFLDLLGAKRGAAIYAALHPAQEAQG